MTRSISCSIRRTVTRPASDLINASNSAVSDRATSLASARPASAAWAQAPCRRAISTRRWSPCERFPTNSFARSCRPNSSRMARARALRPGQAIQSDEIAVAPFETLAGEADVLEYAQTKEQIRDLKGARDAEPRQRKRACPVMSRPSSSTVPESGRSVPAMRLKAVLLPAPFGPMMDVIRRGSASKLSSLRRAARRTPC